MAGVGEGTHEAVCRVRATGDGPLERLMYPLDEAARMVGGLHVRTLKRWAEQGKFPRLVKLGGHLFVLADELTAWVENLRRSKQ